ncbi:MAG TPA: hypothetical protein VH370_06400 [Humisphaera sp.]|jgi:hypothetical protein|nr:hypothetical protein [Humisphaera sp.]
MQKQIVRPGSKLGPCCAAMLAVGLAMLASRSANADLVVKALSTSAAAGSTGNAFDVTLTNTGPASVTISAFAFELSVGPSITLTDVTNATASPYIFDGLGFGPELTFDSPGQNMTASDFFSIAFAGTTIGTAATVGLGHVFFDVAASASSPQTVTIVAGPGTSLSDENATDVAINALVNGTITIPTTAVPAPSAALGGGALLCMLATGIWIRRRRRPIAAQA